MSETPLLPLRVRDDVGVVLTPAKLNLFLELERRRDDGYHELTTLMIPIGWQDRLRFRARPAGADGDRLVVRGGAAPTGPENLVRRALDRLREEVSLPPLDLELDKRIPSEAGLGGGSGNAAGALALANRFGRLGLSAQRLREIASEIGSDVPFFLGGGPSVCRGRGEQLSAFEGSLFGGSSPCFVLIVPGVGCPTAEIFGRISFPLTSPDGPISFPATTFANEDHWVDGLFNRLERPVLADGSTDRERSDPGLRDGRTAIESTRELRRVARWLEVHAPGLWGSLPSQRGAPHESSPRGADSAAESGSTAGSGRTGETGSRSTETNQPTRDRRVRNGVRNWGMTGSGSTFFAVARDYRAAQRFARRARRTLSMHVTVHRMLRPTDDTSAS